MPLYAGIGGAQKEIGELYAGVGGAAKKLEMLYGGVGGVAKELMASGYKWKKYTIGTTPTLEFEKSGSASMNRESAKSHFLYAKPSETDLLEDYDSTSEAIKFESGDELYVINFLNGNDVVTTTIGYYFAVSASADSLKYYLGDFFNVTRQETRFIKYNGQYEKLTSDYNGIRLYGDFYTLALTDGPGDYIETINADDKNAYPVNGIQDGYWYVYDGEITWAKYSINAIYEPSSYDTEENFSSSQTFPILMASQAKKDSNGNMDWGTTYSASSISNLRSNYSTYPYCSFASTLDADNLYMITAANILSYKRKKVSGWAVTSESAGSYLGDVTGKVGDYPENGIQDGYWYIQQEIT